MSCAVRCGARFRLGPRGEYGAERRDRMTRERRERRDGDREACYGKRGLAVKAIECAHRRSRGVETNAFDLMHYTRQIYLR